MHIILENIDKGFIVKIAGDATEDVIVKLHQDVDGKWKIVNSRDYWFSCWSTPSICGIGPTPTPNAKKGAITLRAPENSKAYIDFGELITMPTYKKSELR